MNDLDLNKYLNNKEELPKLKRFSVLGSTTDYNRKLNYLIKIAEPEEWNQTDYHSGYENSTIFYYIAHTFDRWFYQNKIYIDADENNAFFNTGLMDIQGNEIYGHFTKNKFHNEEDLESNFWYFKGFIKGNEREFITKCAIKPEIATYYDDYNELYFDPSLPIELNFDHFYDDNIKRLPLELSSLEKDIAKSVFIGFLDYTKKKIRRNDRIPVPQFYNGKITFLIPVIVFGTKTVIVAIEKINNVYIANTVLTFGMAYNCARLLNKPESNWLLPTKKD